MEFHDDCYRRRLIDTEGNKDFQPDRVRNCLQALSVRGTVELVPDSYKEDEQQVGCEATFRHCSGAYLLYARHLTIEQLDIVVPSRLHAQEAEKIVRISLEKDLGHLLITS